MTRRTVFGAGALALSLAVAGSALAQGTVKIGYIDPLSGAMANIGDSGLKSFQFMAEKINAAGGVAGKKLEIVGLDNETNPEKSLIALKKAIDDGIRFVAQGNGSSVAFALSDAVAKHNRRNPDQSVLYLNYAAVEPGLTNEKCSFWHFRFDADSEMKMGALTDYMVKQAAIKKVYLFNQDYSFGQSVEKYATEMLKKKKPDLALVGAERVPLAKVKDFAPYISKMQAVGADSVVTGNWGADLALLVKAAADSGFKATFYTYYAGANGTPTALGQAGKGTVQISEWTPNIPEPGADAYMKEFDDKYKQEFVYWRIVTLMNMLSAAMNEAKSVDPLKVAVALEDRKMPTPLGEVHMRKDNHQLLQPLYLSVFTDGVKWDAERTGLGFKPIGKVEAKDTALPTTCKMDRPTS